MCISWHIMFATCMLWGIEGLHTVHCVQVAEVAHLSGLPVLEDLYLVGNPIKQSSSYRSNVFSQLPVSANQVYTLYMLYWETCCTYITSHLLYMYMYIYTCTYIYACACIANTCTQKPSGFLRLSRGCSPVLPHYY